MKIALIAGLIALASAGLAISGQARAEVVDQSATGFETRHVVTIAASPAAVYAAILQPAKWWNGAHSFSGDAKNLTMDLTTGCFCEKLPNGFVRHMTVIYADGKTLRLEGSLGPMQSMGAIGHLAFSAKDTGGKTELTVTFDGGGYAKGELAETLAKGADFVLSEQADRLKAYLETGKPN